MTLNQMYHLARRYFLSLIEVQVYKIKEGKEREKEREGEKRRVNALEDCSRGHLINTWNAIRAIE